MAVDPLADAAKDAPAIPSALTALPDRLIFETSFACAIATSLHYHHHYHDQICAAITIRQSQVRNFRHDAGARRIIGSMSRESKTLRVFRSPRSVSVREVVESYESVVIHCGLLIREVAIWSSENRCRYDRSALRYPSDLTDEEWALIEPLIPPAKKGGAKRTVDLRQVVNGLLYVLSTGCQWSAIPKDLPPKSTVYDYFDLWDWSGTLTRIHHALYVLCREAAGREASPT